MREIMSLERFYKIKNELASIIEKLDNAYKEENEDTIEIETYKEYAKVQEQLLVSDLSLIPFDAWKDVSLVAPNQDDRILDLSKTKANIDFSLLEGLECDELIAHNCNIKNLDKAYTTLYSYNFDEDVIKQNSNLFLSSLFSDDIKDKFANKELTIEDLSKMDDEQLTELESKVLVLKSSSNIYKNLDMLSFSGHIGLKKLVNIYQNNPDVFMDIYILLFDYYNRMAYSAYEEDKDKIKTFFDKISSLQEASEIVSLAHQELYQNILHSKYSKIDPNTYTEGFKKEFPDVFLSNTNLPENVKKRYYDRELSIEDVIKYSSVFSTPIDNFIKDYDLKKYAQILGEGNLQQIVTKHKDFFIHLLDRKNQGQAYSIFPYYLEKTIDEIKKKYDSDGEALFSAAVIQYIINDSEKEFHQQISTTNLNETIILPEYMHSFDFKVLDEIKTSDDFQNLTDKTIVINDLQAKVLAAFGINNLKHFEEETNFFLHKKSPNARELENLELLTYCFRNLIEKDFFDEFKMKNYEEFQKAFAKSLLLMKKRRFFTDYADYDFINGSFRDNNSEIFIDENAPKQLKELFYKNSVTPAVLKAHPDSIKYLFDKELSSTLGQDFPAGCINSNSGPNTIIQNFSFMDFYVNRYGKKAFLELLADYGELATDLKKGIFNVSLDREGIEDNFRKTIYKNILSDEIKNYTDNLPRKFKDEYPELFLDDSIDSDIKEKFYHKSLSFEDFRLNPKLETLLADKNSKIIFPSYIASKNSNGIVAYNFNREKGNRYKELLDFFGKEKLLQLATLYGEYLECIQSNLSSIDKNTDFEDLKKIIENIIIKNVVNGNIPYQENAPEFLKLAHPELFLDITAPEELKNYFYKVNSNYQISFNIIKKNPQWLPYLKEKTVKNAILRNPLNKEQMTQYFNLFGDAALKVALQKTETIEKMVSSNKVELLNNWYEKTGKSFVPDYVVMQNFPFEKADQFLVNGKFWSKLMQNKQYSEYEEGRDTLLKLAYSFGVFDGDTIGFKKLEELLKGSPKKIEGNNLTIINNIIEKINYFDKSEKNNKPIPFLYDEFNNLKQAMILEKLINNDEDDIFKKLYHIDNEAGSLVLNGQVYPKTASSLRRFLEKSGITNVINPEKAHQFFGGFVMQYDPDFREFLLKNLDTILDKPEYASYISSIQRQFSDIKAINSNRLLTFELALSYVQTNRFANVELGNDNLSEISSIAGYSQQDFEILQRIYNIGKTRVYSSIPRISNSTGDYSYEMLRLDDPLAVAIGTLTDCCQELHNVAEICMEHSMVDQNGRVFVIKDKEGNPVAQSWVWRNKNVVCFDNIEIPNRAFKRFEKDEKDSTRTLAKEVYDLYKMAANDLIKEDEKVYQQLLTDGKITQEQYEELKISRVTVGLGYNDIAEQLKSSNSKLIKDGISRPLEFTPPVPLTRSLYTNDSTVQYILEENDYKDSNDMETIAVHNDDFTIYDDNNIKPLQLLTLEKFEISNSDKDTYLHTSIPEYMYDDKKIVSSIARNYDVEPLKAKIIMNSNFAIIFEETESQIKIADIFYNKNISNEEIKKAIILQMHLALNQIKREDKKFNIEELSDDKKSLFESIDNLSIENNMERGDNFGRK